MLLFWMWGWVGAAWAAEGPSGDSILPPPAAAPAEPGCGTGPSPGMRLAVVRTGDAREAVQEALGSGPANDPDAFVWCGPRTGVALVNLDHAPTQGFFASALVEGEAWIREDGPMAGAQNPAPKKAEAWDLNPVIAPDDSRKGGGVTIFFLDGGLASSQATGIRRGPGACFTDSACPGDPPSTCTDTAPSGACAVCESGSPACAHGTTVSLLAGARVTPTTPGSERRGVAPDAIARHARVLVDDGHGHGVGRESDLVRAVEWVLAEPISPRPPVVNLSLTLGGESSREVCAAALDPHTDDDPPVLKALQALLAEDTNGTRRVVVAAAGPPVFDVKTGEVTDATGAPTFEWAPACLPGVISVAAADRHGVLADWSNPGDLLAPGGPLVVEGSAQPVTGSSFAAAYVSGIYAALIGNDELPGNPAAWRARAASDACPPSTNPPPSTQPETAPALCPAGLR